MSLSQVRDPYTHWGRGLSLALALAATILDPLDHLPIGRGHTIPLTTILMFVVVVLAVGSVIRHGTSLRRWYFVPPLLMGVVLIGTLGGLGREGSFVAMVRVWSLILFATAVAIHFAEQSLERVGVLTAAVLGGMGAALLALGDFFGISSTREFLNLHPSVHSTWSLFMRPSGPFEDAEALGWMMALLAPVAAAGVFVVGGKRRELIALAFALLWAGLVASLSYSAPIAALTGLLILLLSRTAMSKPYPGLPFLLAAVSLMMAMNPVVKARWNSDIRPINAVAEAVDVLDGAFADDSLQIVIANEGSLRWPKNWEAGVHLLKVKQISDDNLELKTSSWMGQPLSQKIEPGESSVVQFPFRAVPGSGFLVVDLRGPGGFLSLKEGVASVITFRCTVDTDGFLRLGGLTLVRSEVTLFAVMRALREEMPLGQRQNRWSAWCDAVALLKGRPFTGLGPGAMQSLLGYNSGNLYLQTAVDQGLVGVVVLLGTLLVLFVALSLRRDAEGTLYAALMIVVLVYGMLDYVHDHLSVAVFSALLFGLAWAVGFERQPDSPHQGPKSRQAA
ncbi:MAG: hypothetical protein V2A56_02830 [bacterium]